MKHIPVLLEEVIEGLQLSPGDKVIDATLGLAGHTKAMLSIIGAKGKVYGFDRDARNLALAKQELANAKNVECIHASFGDMNRFELPQVQAILFDLGFSSLHVDEAQRGFSFMQDGPLDMRYDTSQGVTAEEIVNGWSKDELAKLFRLYGEEPRAFRIAKAIFDARRKERITTTRQLAELVEQSIGRSGKAHPATRIFQAIRIAVNDEFGEIERGLQAAEELLAPGGRIAVISFHSLEDRLIKRWFKSSEQLEIITKKPIIPTREESLNNSRARSAKLRIAQKT